MKKMLMEKAQQMAILDAIEKGATKSQIIGFMKTDEFKNAMLGYYDFFMTEFVKNIDGKTVIANVNKNMAEGIAEDMRVIRESGFYMVQSFSENQGRWITQKEHLDRKAAVADCMTWY